MRVRLRRLAVWLGVLAFIPVVLTLIYALPFVHPVSTLMLKDLVTLQGYDRRWVEIEDVQPALLHSIIMSEDGQFCRHYGIDLGAVKEVIGDALDGSPTRGASTITMQVVKNLYLWQGRSVLRKVLEAPLAVMADLILSKKRIMEIYINIAELGPHTYGFEAAAQRNFGRSAADLSRRQAALLTVTLPNPFLRKATKPGPGLSRLARLIERRAIKAGDYVGCVN